MVTPNIIYLPDGAAGVAAKQDWNDETIIIHLVSLIQDYTDSADKRMEIYFREMAGKENREFDI